MLSSLLELTFICDMFQTTPFVRQNTPHPKELKAKAHKLFGKTKGNESKEYTNEDAVST